MLMSLSASRAQQLLSRGGPSVVKSEMLSSSPSPLGPTRSSTAAAASAKAAAAAAANAEEGEEASGSGASAGLYATNHYASGAAYDARHTGPYATAEAAAAGGDGDGAEAGGAAAVQARPQGSSAAAVAAAAAAAAAGGLQGGSLFGRDGAAAAGAAAPTHHHAARGRPVVSGMEIMVGGGPRMGMAGGAEGEERKFVGAYSPEARRQRIERFLQKREKRVSQPSLTQPRQLSIGLLRVIGYMLRVGSIGRFVDTCSFQSLQYVFSRLVIESECFPHRSPCLAQLAICHLKPCF